MMKVPTGIYVDAINEGSSFSYLLFLNWLKADSSQGSFLLNFQI